MILSGTLDDGAAGLAAIKAKGGVTIAQSPESAAFADMPRNAIEWGAVHLVLALEDVSAHLLRLVGYGERPMDADAGVRATDMPAISVSPGAQHPGDLSIAFRCPDCGGVLRHTSGPGEAESFRCMVGHAWSGQSLLAAQLQDVEESLWAALRALEEHRKLSTRLLEDARARGSVMVSRYEEKLRDIERSAHSLAPARPGAGRALKSPTSTARVRKPYWPV